MKNQVIIFSTLMFSILFSCSKEERRTEKETKVSRDAAGPKITDAINLPTKKPVKVQLKEIKNMLVKCGKIRQDTPVEKILELTRLNFHSYDPALPPTDLSNLSLLTKLKSLSTRVQLEDISFLDKLTNLTSLTISISSANVNDLSVFSKLTKLKWLHFYRSQLTDLNFLNKLINIEALHLYKTGVNDITALNKLTKLKKLNLAETKVSNVLALRNLKDLTSLNISRTEVSDISALSTLTSLDSLYISGSPVSDISHLSELKELEYLEVKEGQLSTEQIQNLKENLPKLTIKIIEKPLVDITVIEIERPTSNDRALEDAEPIK